MRFADWRDRKREDIDPRIYSSRAGFKGSHSLIISLATALGLAVNHLDLLTGVGNVLRNYL